MNNSALFCKEVEHCPVSAEKPTTWIPTKHTVTGKATQPPNRSMEPRWRAALSFDRGYYGPPGESCWYCGDYYGYDVTSTSVGSGLDTSTIWRCPVNNLSFPMPLTGYFVDVCQGQPATGRSCQPHEACQGVTVQNLTAMFTSRMFNGSDAREQTCAAGGVLDGACEVGGDAKAELCRFDPQPERCLVSIR